MSSIDQLHVLVQLAKVDGVVVQDEIDLIKQIGEAHGLSSEEISACFGDPDSEISDLSNISDDEKYEYIYNLVQLMKIDGRLYKEEINFCSRLAGKLGYDDAVLLELMVKVYSDPDITTDKESLKSTIQKFLKH